MKYQGGKARIARRLMEKIEALAPKTATRWVEPFVGGAWMLDRAYQSERFTELYAGDVVPDLIMLYEAVADGWEIPREISRELYFSLKKAEPSPLRGIAGFGSAYGGNWFTGYCGDALNGKSTHAELTADHLERRRPMLAETDLRCIEYWEWTWLVNENTVVYCDPPYAGTIGYKGARGGKFDSDQFWRWVYHLAIERGAHVFVSEYSGPDWAAEVWSRTAKQTISAAPQNHTVTDRLFYINADIASERRAA